MKKLLSSSKFLLLLICLFTKVHSQTKQGNQWFFGTFQGLCDFNTSVTFLDTTFSITTTGFLFGKSNVCDSNGQLSFLSNGMRLFNKSGLLLENGDTLVPASYFVAYGGGGGRNHRLFFLLTLTNST